MARTRAVPPLTIAPVPPDDDAKVPYAPDHDLAGRAGGLPCATLRPQAKLLLKAIRCAEAAQAHLDVVGLGEVVGAQAVSAASARVLDGVAALRGAFARLERVPAGFRPPKYKRGRGRRRAIEPGTVVEIRPAARGVVERTLDWRKGLTVVERMQGADAYVVRDHTGAEGIVPRSILEAPADLAEASEGLP